MKKILYSLTLLSFFGINHSLNAQCEATASASSYEIYCGQSVDLTGFGKSSGTVILDENFDGGNFGPGWGSTPGATNFSNPCSSVGVDGTPHAWMDANTSVPRTLVSTSYDLSTSTAGVTICFDMLFAEQGDASPCEGPDEPDEGVYLEYSTDGGTTWTTIHYFDPNGGNDPQLTNWNNWCFQIPPAAITSSTQFRWHQTADSGADYDHWGIDNVEIYQNDVNAELEWLHDGYSYGVGNPGGVNPNSVSPTSTTTYTLQLTTGDGTVCTHDVTIAVLDPVIESDIVLDPTSICPGECADFVGDASWVIDPGGIETYENNQTEIVATGSASVNINIQDLNMSTIDPGSIQEICINNFNFSGTQLCTSPGGCNCNGSPINAFETCNIDASNFEITLITPDGCEITLVPSGDLITTGIQDMCFIPSGGTPLSGGSGNYSGQFDPTDPISGLDGCQANGVWTLEFDAGGGFGFGFGSLTGWNITFDDPPIEQPINHTWSPTTGLSDPSILTPEACPSTTTTYTLEMDNGTPGCATQTEGFSLIVDACNGCPTLIINNLNICSPSIADLNDAIDATSDPATISFHNTQAEAENANGTIGSTVSASGSYWVRAEDPLDPTCFNVFEIVVNIVEVSYTSIITETTCGNNDGEIVLTPTGGSSPYTFSIDNNLTTQNNGTFINLNAGSYSVVITDANGCTAEGVENINNLNGPSIDNINTIDPSCFGLCDGTITVDISGGDLPYTYAWEDQDGTIIGGSQNNISDLCDGTYTVTVTDNNGCDITGNIVLTQPQDSDASFTGLNTEYCINETAITLVPTQNGGTFSGAGVSGNTFNPNIAGEGTHTITYIIGNSTCGDTVSINVGVGGPTADFTADPTITSLENTVIDFTNESQNAVDYTWDFGDNSANVNDIDPTHVFSNIEPGTYTVTLTAYDANNCTDTQTVIITIVAPEMNYEIPNVFTPNGDGDNEFFQLINGVNIDNLEVIVLNRWGNLVFESDKVDFKWNGLKNNNGPECTDGTYFYKILLSTKSGEEVEEHGFVQLSRGQ